MTGLRTYEKYRTVKYDYVSQLPIDWKLLPNIAIFQERIERGHETEELLSVTIGRGVIKQSELDKKDSSTLDKSKYLLLYPGDLVYSMRFRQGASGCSSYKGIVSPACTVLKPKKDIKIDPRYFFYIFRTGFYKNYVERFAYGIADGQIPLRYRDFKRMYSIVPPLEIQNSIVAYLDKKNNEIDKFIRNKERLIELLEEQKKNEVFNLITKGAFDHTQSKECGISWIEKIPTDWKIRRFSWEVIIQEGPGIMAVDFRNEGVPLMRISGLKGDLANLDGCNYLDPKKVKKKWNHFRLNKGDILISASASTDIVCEVADEAEGSIPYTGIIRLLPRTNGKRLNKEYLKLYISSKIYNQQVELLKEGSTIQHYGPTHLKGFFLFLPTIEEQQEIVLRAKKVLRILNLANTKAQKEISSIKEYREALITDLVTGKRCAPEPQRI
jgi:type I restriction enzyme, S subunit